MKSVAEQIYSVINSITADGTPLDLILIEEVNLHKSRLAGKTLDGAHWILMDLFSKVGLIDIVQFRDSDGPTGWRTRLGLKLSEDDKRMNKEHKALNKKKQKGQPDHIVINKKHLASRYVNTQLNMSFDVDMNASDNDVVDAIGLGLSELLTM